MMEYTNKYWNMHFSRRSACDFKRCAVSSDHEGNGHFDQCQ